MQILRRSILVIYWHGLGRYSGGAEGVEGMECEGMCMVVGLLPGASKGTGFHETSLHNLFSFDFL